MHKLIQETDLSLFATENNEPLRQKVCTTTSYAGSSMFKYCSLGVFAVRVHCTNSAVKKKIN